MTPVPELMRLAAEGRVRFFFQFGGLGAPWFRELREYFANPDYRPLIEACLDSVEEEAFALSGSEALPGGFPIRQMLLAGQDGDDAILNQTAVSIPFSLLTQVLHLEFLFASGFDRSLFFQSCAGGSGHSLGLITATLAARNLSGEALQRGLISYFRYIFRLSVRSQQAFPHISPTDAEIREAADLGARGVPGPMLALLGSDHDLVKELAVACNGELASDREIYISLYNSPGNRILSSHHTSLLFFLRKHSEILKREKMKAIFLQSTSPFHCPLLADYRLPFEDDLLKGYRLPEDSTLQVPVYSFYDGRDLGTAADLSATLAADMVVNTVYWNKSLEVVLSEKSLTHLIDFGPGKAGKRLSEDICKEAGREIMILSAAVSADRKRLLDPDAS